MKKLIRGVLGGLLRIAPVFRHCVVYGWPDTEGNSVEVVRYLSRHYRGRVFWLLTRPENDPSWLLDDIPGRRRLTYLPKGSWRSLLCYLTAEAVFYTHGLYLSPSPGKRRTFVNLWHGDGPKKTENNLFKIEASASLLVSGTRLWGENKRIFFGMKPGEVAVVGNPRIDQFQRPCPDAAMISLGLDATRPFLLWLPTYRQVSRNLGTSWQDGEQLSAQEDIRRALRFMAEFAAKHGLQIVLKPHPMEADQYHNLGIKILTETELAGAHVTFYQLMARSSALVTDYSSVWTDYLALDRPVAFFCPDLGEYEANRGFNVDNFADLLPGPMIRTEEEISAFLHGVVSGRVADARRQGSIKRIGAVTETGACQRLFAAINRQRASLRLAPLVDPAST